MPYALLPEMHKVELTVAVPLASGALAYSRQHRPRLVAELKELIRFPSVSSLFREHVWRVAPSDVKCSVRVLSSARPALLHRDDPAMRAAALAFRKSFGSTPVFLRNGGPFPVVSMLQDALGTNTVLMGFALPDDRLQGPNEKFHLPNFYNGIAACIWFLTAVGANVNPQQFAPLAERSMAYGD
jgi:acetylornithine deacetylase/succinyl-diaminopimelate desuccinylase-like protein